MINKALTHPESIVVVGASNDINKPGGKVLKNLIDGGFSGKLYVMNPKETSIQGIISYADNKSMPKADLAIIAIAARFVPDLVDALIAYNNTRAFIILSAGFSEESAEGKILEERIVQSINNVNGALIGPNCVGILTPQHHSIFTKPIPKLDPKGCDFISGSGATACFIMEAGIPNGLRFSNVFSVGNSAQMGVEEILQYMDESFDAKKDSTVKLLYIENIDKPAKLLKHARSLISKGCRIAAIKAGGSEAGSRAASSHTGALASSDTAVEALFRKAGIVRCHSREELITVAGIFMHPELKGKRIAIITHAGGPAVMLTDALSNNGLEVPAIKGNAAENLKEQLFAGSSVNNPIDFLATGTAGQLGKIITACDQDFDHIDAMIVIFGTPGLFEIFDVYEVLDRKMKEITKPLFPVLPSTLTAAKEVEFFLNKGHVNFPDEVNLGRTLAKVYQTPKPSEDLLDNVEIDHIAIRKVINDSSDGYLNPENVSQLLDAAGITRAGEAVVNCPEDALNAAEKLGYPLVMKVVGPVHKSDVGGVVLNIDSPEKVTAEFNRMKQIPETTAILMQPMLKGTELFAGATREDKFGHLVFFGLGGIFIEVLKDVASGLIPISEKEAVNMIQSIKSYPILKGIRGQEGVNEEALQQIIIHLSALLQAAPEIAEMDINPLLGNSSQVVAVDARIRIKK
ncbi:MAG: acetate--CoA ligase family protein [Bacteroidales bacterium]|jgi:acetyltransferase|nr:acetate--CoA ligase family protein [Bacteroidales bacterium]